MYGTGAVVEQTVSLAQLLGETMAPEAGQNVVYGVDSLGTSRCCVHDADTENSTRACGERHPEIVVRKITADQLQQALKNDGVSVMCPWIKGSQLLHLGLLISNVPGRAFSTEPFGWVNCALALFYEQQKPEDAENWCLWACRKTLEQIRREAQNALKWGRRFGLQTVACFEVNGCTKNGWMIGVGDHVNVKRPQDPYAAVSHGLIPGRLLGFQRNTLTSITVPVGKSFTKTHLELAASLYETETDGGQAEQHELLRAAERAVETARLVLA